MIFSMVISAMPTAALPTAALPTGTVATAVDGARADAAELAPSGCCHFSYAPQHSYTSMDLAPLHVHTRDVWYVNGDGCGGTSSVEEFINMNESAVRAGLRAYFTTGMGRNVSGGLSATTNAIILDTESPQLKPGETGLNLKFLGRWLAAERANGSKTFQGLVDAYALRTRVLKSLAPNALVGVYGSPNGPDAFQRENFTLSMEGLVEGSRRGLFDHFDFLLPVLYFGENASSPHHTENVEGFSNTTIKAALSLRTSRGDALPIIVNTKPTYGGGPLNPPYAGWVEPATTRRLVALWRAVPRVQRIQWWFYPDNELTKYNQPNLTEIRSWFERNQPVPAECNPRV